MKHFKKIKKNINKKFINIPFGILPEGKVIGRGRYHKIDHNYLDWIKEWFEKNSGKVVGEIK